MNEWCGWLVKKVVCTLLRGAMCIGGSVLEFSQRRLFNTNGRFNIQLLERYPGGAKGKGIRSEI